MTEIPPELLVGVFRNTPTRRLLYYIEAANKFAVNVMWNSPSDIDIVYRLDVLRDSIISRADNTRRKNVTQRLVDRESKRLLTKPNNMKLLRELLFNESIAGIENLSDNIGMEFLEPDSIEMMYSSYGSITVKSHTFSIYRSKVSRRFIVGLLEDNRFVVVCTFELREIKDLMDLSNCAIVSNLKLVDDMQRNGFATALYMLLVNYHVL